ncbi:MAG: alpha-amylase family glycosyl hydrolase [Ruminococcus sp.]|nr:alpha-amylase family glycosyl hydrolase [Ruminococcus sp.]
MKYLKTALALVLCLATLLGVGVVSVFSAETELAETEAGTGITVHYYYEGGTPYVYYWNALPANIETAYPGVKMTPDAQSGANWYKYEFKNSSKINLLFTDGTNTLDGQLTGELTRNAGNWYYVNNKWKSSLPDPNDKWERTDMREDSIYFVITTRFYDGDKGNNVHCWDDGKANNPDSDPAWRGDFKGLADKLDYIKALGFSAIWITPVVENASGYDYHGYHALDFSTVDARYESSDFTYQDLIDAAHDKGMKIVQDVVWNHSGNFGEAFLAPMFEKEYSSLKDLESIDSMKIIEGSRLSQVYPNYNSMLPDAQYQARLAIMKEDANDTNHYYHHDKSLSYGSYTEQTGQMAGDCVDINTENQVVADYLTETYMDYVNMGVDCFRLDTEKHINRWTLNNAYFPVFNQVENFYIFGEVCARYHGAFNEGGASDSCFFYTWKENGGATWSKTDWKSNYDAAVAHFGQYQTRDEAWNSNNAFLNGITYHTPDYSKANGTGVIDFPMHWAYTSAGQAFGTALGADKYYNDATWNVVYVDSHDYSPDQSQTVRYNGGTAAWAENWSLMFTFRGIPCVYYGSEIEFQKGMVIDVGPNAALSTTGRAYYGDNIEGTVSATDFGEYTASGKVQDTLSKPLAKHLSKLNAIRHAVPALQKGQYTTDSQYVQGNMAYIRRYTNAAEGVDSLALVTVSGGATFKNIPNGKYVDAVTGDVQNVTNGTLTANCSGQGNLRVYVCCASGFDGIDGAIGGTSGQTYLK